MGANRREKRTQGFLYENVKERNRVEDQGVDRRMIFKFRLEGFGLYLVDFGVSGSGRDHRWVV
jgi:hypothetical protein